MSQWSARVDPQWDLASWRHAARIAWGARIAPENIAWHAQAQPTVLALPAIEQAPEQRTGLRIPSAFLQLAQAVLCHRDPQRYGVLYRVLWRLGEGERHLMHIPTDADMHALHALAQAVRRDTHKMKAFVRFRQLPGESEHFIAWFEPEHWIVDRVAPFFARRFAGMRWAILTPYRSAFWNGAALHFGNGAQRSDAPADDAGEALWRTYYANIFNPARLNPRMMRQEMPQKYWKHLPEAAVLPELIRNAGQRVQAMAQREAQLPKRRIPIAVPPTLPDQDGLAALRKAASQCRACPLWEAATQTVMGEGPADARVLLVGEQPGDHEDLTGRPFVGPAGQLLDRALAELGLDRRRLYLTNAVKHFRFERRGQIRLHRNPEPSHVQACRVWLQQELARINPDIVVALGASAALAVFGRGFALMQERGVWQTLPGGTRAFATVHPAWVLRQHTHALQESAYRNWLEDLSLLIQPLP